MSVGRGGRGIQGKDEGQGVSVVVEGGYGGAGGGGGNYCTWDKKPFSLHFHLDQFQITESSPHM